MSTSSPDGARRFPWRRLGWGLAAGVLLLPLVVMPLTDEVRWTASDFVVAGLLLGGTGALVELVVRVVPSARARYAGVAAVLVLLAVVWGALATVD